MLSFFTLATAVTVTFVVAVAPDALPLSMYFTVRPISLFSALSGKLLVSTVMVVGDMTRWNNAKTAEEKDRVKHI